MEIIIQILFFFVIIVPSAIIHEYAHGWAADQLGDPTARLAGRLTLNPKAHIDPIGTLALPIILILLPGSFLFAYAKPVPFNPYNLKYRKWGPAMVAAAGPLSNILLAVIFGLIVRFVSPDIIGANVLGLFGVIVYINVLLAVFNLVPIPPLDGSKILLAALPDKAWQFKASFERNAMLLFIFFIFIGFRFIFPVIIWLMLLITGEAGAISAFEFMSNLF